MRVSKNAMLWFVLIGAFFYPSGIIGTSLSKVWYYWQLSSIVLGAIYIFFKIKIVKHIEKSTWFIVLFYVFQILATSINGLAITYDLKSFFMMSTLVIVTSLLLYEYRNSFILFLYRILWIYICLNFLSVIILYKKGMTLDAYDTPIYFWSTKNHIISLTLVFLTIGFYLYTEGLIARKKYNLGNIAAILAVFLMGSSTAITALIVYCFFLLGCEFFGKNHESFNMKTAVSVGVFADVLIVVLRVQEKLGTLIDAIFGKDTTLTGRTDLWDQAFDLIGMNFWYGKGNSYAISQYGWLTKEFWNDRTQVLENTYFVSHNQFLEILVNGGIICLVPFMMTFYSMIASAKKIQNYKYKNMIAAAILAYFVAMITDLVTPYEMLYLFILVSAYIYKCEDITTERMRDNE